MSGRLVASAMRLKCSTAIAGVWPSVNGDRREPVGCRDIGQVLAKAFFVDAQVVGERQQDGRYDAFWHIMGMAGHFGSPCERGGSQYSGLEVATSRRPSDITPAAGVSPPYITPPAAFGKTPRDARNGPARQHSRADLERKKSVIGGLGRLRRGPAVFPS